MCREGCRSNHESVITFNELCKTGESMGPLPQRYAGFMWSPSAWFMTREQMPSLRTTQSIVLFNDQGKDLFFESEEPFGLKEVLLSALWDGRCDVLIEGWKKGRGRYATPLTLTKNVVVRSELTFADIDRVWVKTRGTTVAIHAITVIVEGP